MKRTTYIALGVVLVASFVGFFVFKKYTAKETLTTTIKPCTTDVMMCPNGTTIARSGPDCKFGICKQDNLPSYITPVTQETKTTQAAEQAPSSSKSVAQKTTVSEPTTNLFAKITNLATSFFSKSSNSAEQAVATGIKETSQATNNPATNSTANSTPVVNENRYLVIRNNTLVDQNNNVVYVLPDSFLHSSGTTVTMESHFVNAVEVNQVAPVVGAIPIDGQKGKYYLSENSFGDIKNCEFSNKIYILDTIAGTRTLFYEENSTTLDHNDPRACNSEIYLLATEGEKLILKYHTIGTNMVCDSTWSEPEKTWFLDVTKTEKGTRIYPISPTRYAEAEKYEASCREQLSAATSTQ